MIESGRSFEYSGPDLALLQWGSAAKQLVLYVILLNVFVAPWGMASTTVAIAVALAIAAILGKALLLGVRCRRAGQQLRQAAAVQDHRVRLRSTAFGGAGGIHPLPGRWMMCCWRPLHSAPTVFDGIANTVALVVLLLEFGMLRAALLRGTGAAICRPVPGGQRAGCRRGVRS